MSQNIRFPIWIAVLLSALLYIKLADRHPVGFFEDDAIYILAGRSILSGHYEDLTRRSTPPEIHFLPGFPLLLAPFGALINAAHRDFWRIVPCLLAVFSGLLSALLYRRLFSNEILCGALVLYLFNPLVLLLSDVLLSEWLLLCLTLAALVLIDHLEAGSDAWIVKSGLLGTLVWASLTRPEGVLLPIAFLSALVTGPISLKRYRWIPVIPIAVFLGWLLRNWMVGGQISTYVSIWKPPDLLHIIKTGTALPRLVLMLQPDNAIKTVICTLIGIALLTGFYAEIRRGTALWRRTAILYLGLFLAVRMLWPGLDDRFFLPLLPFLCAFTAQGFLVWGRRKEHSVNLLLVFAIFLNLIYQRSCQAALWEPTRLPTNTLSFIQTELPPEATFLTNKGGLLTLYTGRLNSGNEEARSPEELAYVLALNRTSYVWIRRQAIADRGVLRKWQRIDRWIVEWPRAFPLIYANQAENSAVYKISIPDSFPAAYRLYLQAREEVKYGNTNNGKEKLRSALALCPQFPGALNDDAVLELEAGHLRKAEAGLERALLLWPNFALARLNLARVYDRQNQADRAQKQLSLALKSAIGPEDNPIRQLIIEEQQKLIDHVQHVSSGE